MGNNENGIKQTPFSDAWATPDVGGQGMNGIGGGLDQGSGSNGIVNSPWASPFVPTPGGQATADGLESGKSAGTVTIDGTGAQGTHAPWDITSSRNTIDQK